jgi:hypothetical protein
MTFNEATAAGQAFSESLDVFGEPFTYANTALVGVFNQVEIEYQFGEFSTKKITGLMCVTSKPQWAAANIAPADRGVLNYGGINYQIEKIDGTDTAAEPAYGLTLKKLT